MGNEMGNRNVTGLQDEDKAVGEEIEKTLAKGDCEDEVIGENHVVPGVEGKDFLEKVDDLSGGQVLEDGNSLQGQVNESDELKLSSELAETEVSKESDENKPSLDSYTDGNTQIKDQVTIEKDTHILEETEEIVHSTIDSVSSQENFKIEIVDPLINSAEEVVSYDQEPTLLEDKAAQEENLGKDAIVGDEGESSFTVDDSAAFSEEVIDDLTLKHQSLEEKNEMAIVGDEDLDFPFCGSLDSSQEFAEPLEKPTHLTQEQESLGNEKEDEEGKGEITDVAEKGVETNQEPETQEQKSLGNEKEDEEGQCEIANVAEKGVEINQEPEMLVNEKAAQEEKAEVSEEEFVVLPIGSQITAQKVGDALKLQEETKYEYQCVDDTEIASLPAESLDNYLTSFEPQSQNIVIPSLTSQEVCDTEEKSIGLVQETELIIKEKETQEEKFVSLENSFPLLGLVSSPVFTVPTELTVPIQSCQENGVIVTESETKELKVVLEQNNSPVLGSTIPSREVTVPTELIVTKPNSPAIKSATRKSPSFDFDLALESRPSQDSDRTPLLSQDKGATRSQSSRGQQTYQYNNVPLEDEESLVEEKTIMMERSYSEKSTSFMSLLRKEEKGSFENKNKTRNNDGNDSKSEEKVMLSSGKAKRKQKSSFLSTCICCDV